MVEALGPNQKQTVTVMGTLGVGKSTLLNRVSGMAEDPFVASMQTKGCT